MPFSSEELERYARHIVLSDIGGAGQQKLKVAKVLVIGAGGLGSPVLQYLAAAGVGTLGVVDDDKVSLSNLQRQILHDTRSVGAAKVTSAKGSVARINPNVKFNTHDTRLNEGNAKDLIADYDIVVDGCDNFDTRYLVADVCSTLKKPLVTAAVGQFDGNITTLKPYEINQDGEANPSYQDLFPQKPDVGLLPTCAEAGVLGALTGVLGTLQALETIKVITGVGELLVGRLLMFDAKSLRFETINFKKRK